ncbi:MAG: TIGR03960 family B12-binding radical SAM protein [Calditerrivibrio sp.]|nr:TIGR03960 family B12-binding radical SAM protein [Calditerrivibrio sp.]
MNDFVKKLLKVSKPVRYINNEINAVHKNISKDTTTVCLAFPDVYEIGMSHLGMKILYESLNSSEKIVAERFFLPWVDAIETLGPDIFVSLESKIPLKNFDLIGFSLQYELSYTNVLQTLRHSHIPLQSRYRTDSDPIIIAGGPCTFNPAPLSELIDVFFIGEMDEALKAVMEGFNHYKDLKREKRLEYLNSFPFTFVPSIDPNKVTKKHIFHTFSQQTNLKNLLVPLMPITQDRVSIEISRGCTRGCRFCQAGMIYRPVREQSVNKIINNGIHLLKHTGYNEISLMSLSTSDYTEIQTLLYILSDLVKKDMISLTLPSLRADKIDDYIFETLSKVRKSGFTIAPEAGSQRMRDIINKNLKEDEISLAVEKAARYGWNSIKLYFMIGLPFEEEEDIVEIAELCKRLMGLAKNINKKIEITASVSNFVPKPFTPFQWHPQNSREELRSKQRILIDLFKRYKIALKLHDINQSLIEGVFARGDKRLNNLLLIASQQGFYFDGWSEFFDIKKWEGIFSQLALDMEKDFACKAYSFTDPLPWKNIDALIDTHFLWEQYQLSKKEVTTDDCKNSRCIKCGVCDFIDIKNEIATNDYVKTDTYKKDQSSYCYYMFLFEKKSYASLLSALELTRVLSHCFNIVGFKIAHSQGYNPQPKINYVYPLPVGIEGENEVIIVKGEDLEDYYCLLNKMNKILPDGLKIKDLKKVKKYEQADAEVTYEFDEETYYYLKSTINAGECFYIKKNKSNKEKKVSIHDYLISTNDEELTIILKIDNNGGYNLLDFFKYKNYNYIRFLRKKIRLKGLEYV